MMTDLCEADAVRACASAWSSPGRLSPPIASPPSFRNDRRDWPSQKVRDVRGPHKVSMIDPSRALRHVLRGVLNKSMTRQGGWGKSGVLLGGEAVCSMRQTITQGRDRRV